MSLEYFSSPPPVPRVNDYYTTHPLEITDETGRVISQFCEVLVPPKSPMLKAHHVHMASVAQKQ